MVSDSPRYPESAFICVICGYTFYPQITQIHADENLTTMKYFYDDEHDSLFISLRDGEYDESEEIYDGFVIDFDKAGRPLNIDIYSNASKFVDIDRLMNKG
jgi:uncharacterized protein YuzE